jgi:hypothetical protein
MVLALMIGGLVLAGVSLWQVGRLLQQAETATTRLDLLVDELVATAEATTATVADRAEALGELLSQADERVASLQAMTAGAAGAPVVPQAPARTQAPSQTQDLLRTQAPAASVGEIVRARLAAGQDEATIARELGLARTAVRLAARTGGDR